jgi:hypothetical protein
MSAITDAKDAIKAVLSPIITTYTYIEARPIPPCVTITAGSPYLQEDITFGSYRLNFSLELTMQTGANDRVTEELDAYIDDIVVALVNAGYGVANVSQPYAMEANNTQYLSVSILCSTVVKL